MGGFPEAPCGPENAPVPHVLLEHRAGGARVWSERAIASGAVRCTGHIQGGTNPDFRTFSVHHQDRSPRMSLLETGRLATAQRATSPDRGLALSPYPVRPD